MGWVVGPPMETDQPPDPAEAYERKMFAKATFWDLYELIKDHTDWVSINWYVTTHPGEEDEPGVPNVVRPLSDFTESMDTFLTRLEKVAPGKPVLLTETGFPPPEAGKKMAECMKLLLSHKNVKGMIFWTDSDILCQVRPGEPEARVLKAMIEKMPEKFPSKATCFPAGSEIQAVDPD